MRWTIPILLVALAVGPGSAAAAEKTNLIEYVQAELTRDRAIGADDRVQLLDALRHELGAYAFDLLKPKNRPAAEILVGLAGEGLAGGVAVERTAAVAAAAYQAMARGAPPELVAGIARYGFERKLSAERIATWTSGAAELLKFDLPRPVVEDLIHNAVQGDWPADTFRAYKWALVRAVRAGHHPEGFARYLMALHAKGDRNAGAVAAAATRAFGRAARAGQPPPTLPYSSPVLDPDPPPESPHRPPHQPPPRLTRQAKLDRLMASLTSFLGTPYVWGGRSRRGTDCSGMTQTVFAEVGHKIGRRVRDQWKEGRPVARRDLRPGDLVFFLTMGQRISHVGMVTDPAKDEFIHASSTRGVVRSRLTSSYYKTRWAGARRLF